MSEREWRLYLDDMIDFSKKVLAYTNGLDQAAFVASEMAYVKIGCCDQGGKRQGLTPAILPQFCFLILQYRLVA